MTSYEERLEAAAVALAHYDGYLWESDLDGRDLSDYRARARVALSAASLGGLVDPGPNPDLIDRDGDRWRETYPDAYWMVVEGDVPLPHGRLPSRAIVEENAGPVVEVLRPVDAGPLLESFR